MTLSGSNFGLVPERTARRNAMEACTASVFEQYGYNEISLPIYEYYTVLKNTSYDFRDENIITFIDRSSGRSLVLRPDFTPQVSRMISGYRDIFPVPARVYYRGTVFRNVSIDQGAKAEKYHIGCELYGADELDGDRELLLCLHSCMEAIGLDHYLAVFGDAAYISALLTLLGERSAEYMSLLRDKKLHGIKEFVANFGGSGELSALLRELPLMFGGQADLERLKELSAFDPALSVRSEYVYRLFSEVVEYGFDKELLIFDPAEMRGLDYYTGVSFEIIHPATGSIIGGGGRYDNLMRKFNMDYTACGMALYLSEIEAVTSGGEELASADWIVVGKKNTGEAQHLRREGKRVIQIYNEADLEPFLARVKVENILR